MMIVVEASRSKETLLNREMKSFRLTFSLLRMLGTVVFAFVSHKANILSYINYPKRCSRARNNKIKPKKKGQYWFYSLEIEKNERERQGKKMRYFLCGLLNVRQWMKQRMQTYKIIQGKRPFQPATARLIVGEQWSRTLNKQTFEDSTVDLSDLHYFAKIKQLINSGLHWLKSQLKVWTVDWVKRQEVVSVVMTF